MKHLSVAAAALLYAVPAQALAQQNNQLSHPVEGDVRSSATGALQSTLFDLIALKHATQQEHWNVIGSDFYQLHEFYGELYTALDGPIDDVAERMRALGAAADGRASSVGRSSSVRAPNVEMRAGQETLRLLHRDWSGVRDRLYEEIEATADDPVTQDLLIGIAYTVDKFVWQLRAHLG